MSFVFGDEFKIVSDFPQKHLRDLDPVLTARRREKGLQIRSSKLREKITRLGAISDFVIG